MELAWRVGICCIVVGFAAAVAASDDWLVTDSFTRQFGNLQQILWY